MRIDICRCAEVGVPEPFLDLLQRNTICQQQACTAMSQIVEAHFFHPMPLDVLGEIACQIIRFHSLAEFIHKDVPVVLIAVAVTTDLLIKLLCLFYFREVFLEAAHQKQRPETGFRLSGVLLDNLILPVNLCLGYSAFDEYQRKKGTSRG